MTVSAPQPLCYQSLLAFAGTEIIMPSRRPIAKGSGPRELVAQRHVARTCFARASNQLAPAVLSPCAYIISDGAVEPENVVRDVAIPFSRSRAIPLALSSAST